MAIFDTEITIQISATTCAICGIPFGLSARHEEALRESHASFYCPNGHSLSFKSESTKEKAERLQRELERNEAALRQARTDSSIYRNEAFAQREKRLKLQKRIRAGVCPHCTRSFQNLKRHIECKHSKGRTE